jgi:malonyl-CoA O-methyltransferase
MSERGYFDLTQVRRNFDRASASFDDFSAVHAEIRKRLLERLDYVKIEPRVVLDLGAGTGDGTRELKRRYRSAEVVALDVSTAMLRSAARRSGWRRRFERICGDAHRLPFRDSSVELVVSNLMLHWCQPPDEVFAEVARVLVPGGLFMFSTVGPDTLRELRTAWQTIDAHAHIHPFIDMHDLGDALMRAHFAQPVMDVERIEVTYASIDRLLEELAATGARNLSAERTRGLTTQRSIVRLRDAMQTFVRGERIPATTEVVYGHAWAPSVPQTSRRSGNEVHVPIAQLQRRTQR